MKILLTILWNFILRCFIISPSQQPSFFFMLFHVEINTKGRAFISLNVCLMKKKIYERMKKRRLKDEVNKKRYGLQSKEFQVVWKLSLTPYKNISLKCYEKLFCGVGANDDDWNLCCNKEKSTTQTWFIYKTKAAKWISKINYLATEKTPIKLKMKWEHFSTMCLRKSWIINFWLLLLYVSQGRSLSSPFLFIAVFLYNVVKINSVRSSSS